MDNCLSAANAARYAFPAKRVRIATPGESPPRILFFSLRNGARACLTNLVACSVVAIRRHGIDRHQVAPAIQELIAVKLLEITRPGRAGTTEYRTPNLFRLTYRHTKREEPSHWKTPPEPRWGIPHYGVRWRNPHYFRYLGVGAPGRALVLKCLGRSGPR